MRYKYYIDRMVYTLHNSPIKGQKEYWETDIEPIVLKTNDLEEAKSVFNKEVESNKNKLVEVMLLEKGKDEDIIIKSYTTLKGDISIRI